MAIAFAEYLEAKIALDDRSLNKEVFSAMGARIGKKQLVRGLDVGTGSGAMIRRILSTSTHLSMSWTGLDTDKALLSLAANRLQKYCGSRGNSSTDTDCLNSSRTASRSVTVAFEQSAVADYRTKTNVPEFNLITAHAVMDLLPMRDTIDQFYAWLKKDGVFYATINYNGKTTIKPDYIDAQFETHLLRLYDESMDQRRSNKRPTGGAYSGQRLRALLARSDFEIIASGDADWDLAPVNGGYRDSDKICIYALVDMIWEEGRRCPELDQAQLADWLTDRHHRIDKEQLAFNAHNLDILAVKQAGSLPKVLKDQSPAAPGCRNGRRV